MKGIVFTEFIDMVETNFGLETSDKILQDPTLKTFGAYTAVGTYNHLELVTLVTSLSKLSKIAVPQLIKSFGKHLHSVFIKKFPNFYDCANAFNFFRRIDNYIHLEVKKLYPDAELPKFDFKQPDENTLILTYSSTRPFADLAEGLISASIDHFDEKIKITTRDLSVPGRHMREFTLTKI